MPKKEWNKLLASIAIIQLRLAATSKFLGRSYCTAHFRQRSGLLNQRILEDLCVLHLYTDTEKGLKLTERQQRCTHYILYNKIHLKFRRWEASCGRQSGPVFIA